jgi:hypothetical protein
VPVEGGPVKIGSRRVDEEGVKENRHVGITSRIARSLRLALGASAVAMALLLTSPGVRVVRAEPATSSEGASCQADQPPPGTAEISVLVEEVRRREAARARAGLQPEPDVPVTLNGRGYNLGGDPDIAADLARAVSESR